MSLYWISFAKQGKGGFLGVAIVEASNFQDAQAEATRRKINPGGEALVFAVPPEQAEHAGRYRNRLLGKDEVERVFGAKGSMDDAEAAIKAGAGAVICEKHNR